MLLAAMGPVRACAELQGSASAFALVGERDLEQLPVAVLLLVGHAGVLAEELARPRGWPGARPAMGSPITSSIVTPSTLAIAVDPLSGWAAGLLSFPVPRCRPWYSPPRLRPAGRVKPLRLTQAPQACPEYRSHVDAPVC
jgi:hypothetical protein